MEQKIFINGEIGWWSDLYKDAIWNADAVSLKVLIDSVGGSVTDGNSIAGLLRQHSSSYNVDVETVGIGLVASIATVVLLAGTKVAMDKDALLMIHNPKAEWVSGESKDLRRIAATLDVIKNQLAETYTKKIERNNKLVDGNRQKTKNLVLQYMSQETWFTADKALELGLIDEIVDVANIDKETMQSRIDAMPEDGMQRVEGIVNTFNNVPSPDKGHQKNDKMDNEKEVKSFFALVKSFFVNDASQTAEETQKEETIEAQETQTYDYQSEIESLKNDIEKLKSENETLVKSLESSSEELKNAQGKIVKLQAKASDVVVETPQKEEKKLTPSDGLRYFTNILKTEK